MKVKNIMHRVKLPGKKQRGGKSQSDEKRLVYKSAALSVLILLIGSVFFFGILDIIIPGNISVYNDEGLKSGLITYEKQDGNEISPVFSYSKTIADSGTKELYKAKLFGVIPLKDVEISSFPKTYLIPGGMSFGLKFFTQGVLVIGTSDIETENGVQNPAKSAGLKTSDIITHINGAAVNTIEEAAHYIEASEGARVTLDIVRDSKKYSLILTPVYSVSEKKYKSGIWLRDSTAGIGTVTYINPDSLAFGGLGHGICDIDTGNLMPLKRGIIVESKISDIVKGRSEYPGELKGKFGSDIGTLLANTQNGIFGLLNKLPTDAYNKEALPIGLRSEVKEDKAKIYCTLDDNVIEEYDIEIIKIYKNSSDSKNFLVKIIDPVLLEKTGGIVQGMSGSPIIQNGKIIGAVTHVLVSDPTKGYGIFIDNMLTAMPDVIK